MCQWRASDAYDFIKAVKLAKDITSNTLYYNVACFKGDPGIALKETVKVTHSAYDSVDRLAKACHSFAQMMRTYYIQVKMFGARAGRAVSPKSFKVNLGRKIIKTNSWKTSSLFGTFFLFVLKSINPT